MQPHARPEPPDPAEQHRHPKPSEHEEGWVEQHGQKPARPEDKDYRPHGQQPDPDFSKT